MTTNKTFCSICSAFCGFEAEVEDNRITEFRPDSSHVMSRGFSCRKGRNFHRLLTSDSRESRCLERMASGFEPVARELALDDIAGRLRKIVDEHGPESVAIYAGNGVSFKALVVPAVKAFLNGLGSHQLYTALTIDQPAKVISAVRHGVWIAGGHSFETAKVLMLFGNNPFVSGLNGMGGIPGWQPGAVKEARRRGLKLIVVDPRETETAQQADLHLPIKPGTDAFLLSGMINHILTNNLHDRDFCERFTEGQDALATLVAPYDLETTSVLTGLDVNLILRATELFVSQQRGTANSATGPDMAPHGNLTEHLIYSLNTLCGRHNRAGDKVSVSLLTPDVPPMEAVLPSEFLPEPLNPAGNTRRSRVSGRQQMFGEMPTATLAEEILTPGKGQIRALIVIGGNPALSVPQREQIQSALGSLDLLVCMDGRVTETAEYAHYSLPTTYGLEKTDMTVFNDRFWGAPFHQVSRPVVTPPGDACDEQHYLMALAQRMGIPMAYHGVEIDTANPPDDLALLDLQFPQGTTRVPVAVIAAAPGGRAYPEYAQVEVTPGMEGLSATFQFMPEGVSEEFEALGQSQYESQEGYLLICRRNPHVYNTMCHELPHAPAENMAFMHPNDLVDDAIAEGERILIRSAHGQIEVTARADDKLRRGVLSISHGFGGKNGGASINELLSTADTTDRVVGIPRMSAVPVVVEKTRL
ncbi:MAG: molybdopterin-containing oxidoreductase family protein [Spongiibacteraceae bacterium]